MSDDEKDKSAPGPEGSKPEGASGAQPPPPDEGSATAPTAKPAPAPVPAPIPTTTPAPAAAAPAPGAPKDEAPGTSAPAGDAKPAARARPAAGPDPVEAALRAVVPSVPLERLRSEFPESAGAVTFCGGVAIVKVPLDSIVDVCRFLKADAGADMKYLSNLHATHHPDRAKPFEVVYNLYSITRAHWLELKVELGETEEVPSVSGVWKTATWHEREAFDLLGVRFSGHPDLRRILLPDTWTGHPLRKEYPLEGKEGDHASYR